MRSIEYNRYSYDTFIYPRYDCISCGLVRYYCVICQIMLTDNTISGHEIISHKSTPITVNPDRFLYCSHIYCYAIQSAVDKILHKYKQFSMLSLESSTTLIDPLRCFETTKESTNMPCIYFHDIEVDKECVREFMLNNNYSCVFCGNCYDCFPTLALTFIHISKCPGVRDEKLNTIPP